MMKPDNLERLAVAYVTAATAAGVAVLALAPVSDGKIVYTPTNKKIFPNHTLPFDLNHDGINDFTLVDTAGSSGASAWGFLTVFPNHSQKNRVFGAPSAGFFRYAYAMPAGQHVGPRTKFPPGAEIMAESGFSGGRRLASNSQCKGPWENVNSRYLGLKFAIKGATHYGWARLNVKCTGGAQVDGKLTGYAYETRPNTSITVGKTKGGDVVKVPPTLGHLAKGVAVRSKVD